MGRKTKYAFVWIIKLLKKNNIEFRITGGLASKIYGSDRPLSDIDIEISNKDIVKIKNHIKEYVIYGPKRYKDNEFDLLLMTIKYKGQEMDICGIDSQKIFDKNNKKWVKEKIDLKKYKKKKVFDHFVPIIPLEELINYKKKIRREVDIYDVNILSK